MHILCLENLLKLQLKIKKYNKKIIFVNKIAGITYFIYNLNIFKIKNE